MTSHSSPDAASHAHETRDKRASSIDCVVSLSSSFPSYTDIEGTSEDGNRALSVFSDDRVALLRPGSDVFPYPSSSESPLSSPREPPTPVRQRISYAASFLTGLRNSPLSQLPLDSIPAIAGVTNHLNQSVRRGRGGSLLGKGKAQNPNSRRKRMPSLIGVMQVVQGPILSWERVRETTDQSANIFRLLFATAPKIDRADIIMASSVGSSADSPIFGPHTSLSAIWSFFDRPYGHAMDLMLSDAIETAAFLPHLSGLQLFMRTPSHDGAASRCVCEYFEQRAPDSRPPLFELVEELAEVCPQLMDASTADIDLEKSWFSISWYPILSCKRTAVALSGMFLTYHSFNLVHHPYHHLTTAASDWPSEEFEADFESYYVSADPVDIAPNDERAAGLFAVPAHTDLAHMYVALRGFVPYKVLPQCWYSYRPNYVWTIPANLVKPCVVFAEEITSRHVAAPHDSFPGKCIHPDMRHIQINTSRPLLLKHLIGGW